MNIQYIQIRDPRQYIQRVPTLLPTEPCHHHKSTDIDLCTCTDNCVRCEELIENDIGKFIKGQIKNGTTE